MRAPLSIIIPTLDAEAELPATLAPLVEGVGAGLVRDLVVSDGGSGDRTREIAEAAGASIVTGPPGRGGQLARGAAAARGAWFLFLHADTHLAAGWPEVVAHHIATDPARAGYFRLRFRARGRAPALVAGWANLRSRAGLPYGDQGLLIERQVYEAVGGFPDIPLMEDVAIARALAGRLVMLDATATTDAGRYIAEGWLRRGGRNLWTLARYLGGADPAALARSYRRGASENCRR